MKAHHTLLFILCVLAGLAALCIGFPEDGLTVLGVELRIPTLAEVMGERKPPVVPLIVEEEPEDSLVALTPEELMQQRLAALDPTRMKEFLTYCRTNSARLYMPGGDSAYLDSFFMAVQQAGHHRIRIVHYGDSQIECDRITSLLRQEFQEAWGGQGVGLVPALQTVPTFTSSVHITPEELPQFMPYGPQEKRLEDKFYGPMAKATYIPDSATITLRGIGGKDYNHSRTFNHVRVLTQGPASIQLITRDSLELTETQSGDYYAYSATIRTTSEATLRVMGEARILGIQLDGASGVSMDNIPMRGCGGSELMNISHASIQPFFQTEDVALIILQFGGNAVPYLTPKSLANYKENIKRTIRYFHRLAPKARILFIGPSDMATSVEGEMETYPILPETVHALREAANEAGAAFWNMYAAMGGYGSMVKWVEADPQLAGADYVHFTPLGARHIARLLYRTIDQYYQFYKFRTEEPAPADSLQSLSNDSLQ